MTELDWNTANHQYLTAAIASVKQALERLTEQPDASPLPLAIPPFPATLPPPALETLCHIFGLTPFDRAIILLCAGLEFDSSWAKLCATLHQDQRQTFPTLGLALSALPQATWSSLTPKAPLRYWQLIEMAPSHALTGSAIRLSERVLNYLTGIQYCDDQLTGLIQPVHPRLPIALVESHQQIVEQMVKTWVQAIEAQVSLRELPVLQLCGEDSACKRTIAWMVCQNLGLSLHALSSEVIPGESSAFHRMKLLCEREYQLADTALLLDCDHASESESQSQTPIAQLIEQMALPIMIMGRDRHRQRQRPIITFEIHHPTSEEQRSLWQQSLISPDLESGEPKDGGEADGIAHIPTLVSHFNLSAIAIRSACLQAQNNPEPTPLPQRLWEACRLQARPRLDELSQRIQSSADWEDLILPETELQVLKDVAAHVKQRTHVYENWGFGRKSQRGLGISALFSGASGTGKTMAAEVLGKALKLDVYRIDLSSVVSKYIGETEKNLRRVFDAAEGGGVILLFDEADALFGKRGEVKDSHDRYANMEVGYLLQRMEAYRGLAILTTNLKGSIDQAFLRRIRFIVQFPFPDAVQRAEIWRRSFPSQTPLAELDFGKLAKLNVAGGNIRSIVLNAAFIAADAQEAIAMKHILQAAKSEYLKLERPLTDSEIKGWI
jgi:hypothetical protein